MDRHILERTAKSFQESVERAGPAAGASYTLIGAIILLGGIGYVVDEWRGTSPWFLISGLMLGIVVGMWALAKTVWPNAPAARARREAADPSTGSGSGSSRAGSRDERERAGGPPSQSFGEPGRSSTGSHSNGGRGPREPMK